MCVCVCIEVYIYIYYISQTALRWGRGDPCFTPIRTNHLNPLHDEILNLVQLVGILKFNAILSTTYHAKRR